MMESQNTRIQFPLCPQSQKIVTVYVSNPTEIKSTLSSYTVYTIHGQDQQGQFSVTRRYSQFDLLRQYLLKNWPGCYIPSIPEKKVMNKSDGDFVQHRRIGLQSFCLEIKGLQHLWYGQEIQIFLRKKNCDLENVLKDIKGDSCEDIIKKYDDKLVYLRGRTIDTLVINKVLQFSKFLRKILPMLSTFREMVVGFLDAKNNNYQQYGILYNYILPQYEKCCLSNYVNQKTEGKVIFTDEKDERLAAFLAKMKDIISRRNFDHLLVLIDKQERQISAFLEVYKVHANYEKKISELRQKQKQLQIEQQNLNSGKQNIFKSIFRSNIEQNKKDLERQITVNKDMITSYVLLSDLITLILGFFEIDRFKATKLKNYQTVIKEIAIVQVEMSRAQKALSEHILDNFNLLDQ